MTRYVILVCGCDDTTRIVRTLNDAQRAWCAKSANR